MKKTVFLCIAFIFIALFSISTLAQDNTNKSDEPKKEEKSPLITDWEVNFAAPGQDIPGTLKIEKDGDSLKGAVNTALGEAPMKNIKITDKTFTADITVNVQGQVMEGTITGKLEEDKLTGELTLPGFGAISYSGKKPEKK